MILVLKLIKTIQVGKQVSSSKKIKVILFLQLTYPVFAILRPLHGGHSFGESRTSNDLSPFQYNMSPLEIRYPLSLCYPKNRHPIFSTLQVPFIVKGKCSTSLEVLIYISRYTIAPFSTLWLSSHILNRAQVWN